MAEYKEKDTPMPEVKKEARERWYQRHLLPLALLGISVFIAYSNSLNGTWALDDVVANRPVSITDIRSIIGFRQLAYLTFLINQQIAPFSPASFRLFNIIIHICNAVLVYVLAYKTVIGYCRHKGIPTPRKGGLAMSMEDLAYRAALLSSVFFALHPININAVAYIVQRMASLATFFVLLSLISYVSAIGSDRKVASVCLYLLSGVCVIAGILSKENAVMAVPLMILYDYVFLSGSNRRVFARRVFVIMCISVVSLGLISYFMKFHERVVEMAQLFLHPNRVLPERPWSAVDVYWTPLQHILTEFRVVSRYLFLVVVPFPAFFIFDWWGFPVSKGLTVPWTSLPAILFVALLAVFSLLKMKRFPFLCFGILWYLVALSLESFFAVGADLYFEHRNYLPVSGLFIGIAGQIALSLKERLKEKVFLMAVIGLCLVLGGFTFSRNFVWKDSVTLWGDTLKKNPQNIRAIMSMGNAYLLVADFDHAKRYFTQAIRMSYQDKRLTLLDGSAYRLGLMYLFEKDLVQAKRLLDAVSATIESYHLKILTGFYTALNGNVDEAMKIYNEVLSDTKISPDDAVVVFTIMGEACRQAGLWDKAIENYRKALSVDPGFPAAYYGIGASFMAKADIARAEDYFNKTLLLDPNNVLALSDLADLMLIRKLNPNDALRYAQRAVSKAPPFYLPYLTMGTVLTVLGREEDADAYYKKAADHHAPDYMIVFSRARAYYLKGDTQKAQAYAAELLKRRDLPEKLRTLMQQKKN